ncbi:MAG: hypothetical protein QM739_17975 [Propionivibrio sp.]
MKLSFRHVVLKQNRTQCFALIVRASAQDNHLLIYGTLRTDTQFDMGAVGQNTDESITSKDPQTEDCWSAKCVPPRASNQQKQKQPQLPRQRSQAYRAKRNGMRDDDEKRESNRTAEINKNREMHAVRSGFD